MPHRHARSRVPEVADPRPAGPPRGEELRIFGYRTIKTDGDTTPSSAGGEGKGEAGERGRVRAVYPMLSVFDIAQTDLIDPDAGDPAALAQHLEGEDPAGIAAAVTDHLTAAGWTVTREALPGSANGYTTTDGTRRVVIDEDLSPAQTALHEAEHVLLHADEEPGEYAAHRGIKETEAEAVAYVLAGLLASTLLRTRSGTSPSGPTATPTPNCALIEALRAANSALCYDAISWCRSCTG